MRLYLYLNINPVYYLYIFILENSLLLYDNFIHYMNKLTFLSDPGPIIVYATKPTKANHTYQIKPTKANLPNQTYQTKLKLAYQAYRTRPTIPKLLVKAVNPWVRSAFGNV